MKTDRVLTPEVAATITELLHGPVDDSYGTGTAAAIPGVDVAGKTGTTSNYVDAWFVGCDADSMTVAVWVGYPNSGKPMADRLLRQAGRGRHLPGGDLAQLHDGARCRSCRTRQTRATSAPSTARPPR